VPNEFSSDTRKELQDKDHGGRGRGGRAPLLQCSKSVSQMYLVHGRRSHFYLIHHAFLLFMAETRGMYKMLDFMGST